ncbi:hypothetical protein SAMN02800691_2177 [Luteibacter sp. UNCMF366Tsu5.1]|nr:hypothetical protein SAMN02800691_2177 [Luteibacter sp. UNCMF366Tsu5.1]
MHPPRFTPKHRVLVLSIALSFVVSSVHATGDVDSLSSAYPSAASGNEPRGSMRSGSEGLAMEDVDHDDEGETEEDANDRRFVLQALRERWSKVPGMEWFQRASEATQSEWLGHVQNLGRRYVELEAVRTTSDNAVRHQLEAALSEAGLSGSPDDYQVSLARVIQVGDVRVPTHHVRSLTDACLRADPEMDFAMAVVRRDGDLVAEAERKPLLALLAQPFCRISAADRLAEFDTQQPLLESVYAALLETQLRKAIVEADAQGHLTGGLDAWIKGHDIVRAAMNGAADVDMGTLRFSTETGGVSVSLPQWLVFVKRDAQGNEDGVVLYRPQEQEALSVGSQQELYQYLDIKRMSQEIAGEMPGMCPARPSSMGSETAGESNTPRALRDVVLAAAGPGEGTPITKFFDDLCDKPSLWRNNLQFQPYDSHDFLTNIGTWTKARIDLMAKDIRRLAQAPGLPSLVTRYRAIMDEYTAFNEMHMPTLREFTRRRESEKLTRFFRAEQLIAVDESVDADTIVIEFNGRKRPWTDWVLSDYREHGDNLLALSNNFAQDATLTARDAALAARLNTSEIKTAVERNLRSTYAGDNYIEAMSALLDPSDPRYAKASDLRVAMQILDMQMALDVEYSRGNIDLADYPWLKGVLDGLPMSIGLADVELAHFMISGTRIPGVLAISKTSASGKGDTFVFVPNGPFGRTLYKNDAYFQEIIRTDAFKEYFVARARAEDQPKLDKAIRAARTPSYFYTSFAPIDDFKAECDQVIKDAISNAASVTTSKAEVIWEQSLKGVRYGMGVICAAATAGAGAAVCTAGTAALMGLDAYGAVDKLLRGREDEALVDVAFLWLDAIDVGKGASAGLTTFQPKALLRLLRKTHFSSVDEAKEAIDAAARHAGHFRYDGTLSPALSRLDVDIDQLSALPNRPGKAISGKFYEYRGRVHIVDDGRIFEVFSHNGWASVRVRDPARPYGPGALVVYRQGRWQRDEAGLLGGGKAVSKVTDQAYAPLEGELPAPPTLAFAMPLYDQPFMKVMRWTDSDYYVSLPADSQRAREAFMARRNEFLAAARVNAFAGEQVPPHAVGSPHFVPRPSRPSIPASLDGMSPGEAMSELYKAADGVVVGEGPGDIGGRVFLVDNMGVLRKQGVKTLYVEGLLHDVDQVELDAFFALPKRKSMPANLKARLDRLEPSHLRERHTRYTFSDVVRVAKKHGVRVVAADQIVSTRLYGVSLTDARDIAMPYQAQQVIDAYQAQSPGKWVALVDTRHASTYSDIAGVAERTGAIGIRTVDVPAGNPMTIGPDPGVLVENPVRGRDPNMLRSDFVVEMPILGDDASRVLHVLDMPDMSPSDIPASARRLEKPGEFVLLLEGEQAPPVIYHRNRRNEILRTAIHEDVGGFYVDRAEWPGIHGTVYATVDDLVRDLRTAKQMRLVMPATEGEAAGL